MGSRAAGIDQSLVADRAVISALRGAVSRVRDIDRTRRYIRGAEAQFRDRGKLLEEIAIRKEYAAVQVSLVSHEDDEIARIREREMTEIPDDRHRVAITRLHVDGPALR